MRYQSKTAITRAVRDYLGVFSLVAPTYSWLSGDEMQLKNPLVFREQWGMMRQFPAWIEPSGNHLSRQVLRSKTREVAKAGTSGCNIKGWNSSVIYDGTFTQLLIETCKVCVIPTCFDEMYWKCKVQRDYFSLIVPCYPKRNQFSALNFRSNPPGNHLLTQPNNQWKNGNFSGHPSNWKDPFQKFLKNVTSL